MRVWTFEFKVIVHLIVRIICRDIGYVPFIQKIMLFLGDYPYMKELPSREKLYYI